MGSQSTNPEGLEIEASKTDRDGNVFYEVTAKRRITISKFKGRSRVDLREFYEGTTGGGN